ncbi:MAG TPA: ATPase, T2SS/T4P/T4SS family, partial [Candidatus Tumulicola sp.]
MPRSPASIRLVDAIHAGRGRNASDVHFGLDMPPILRVDGALERLAEPPLTSDEVREIAESLLSATEIARLSAEGDVSTAWSHQNLGRTRAHLYGSQQGLTIAVRLLDAKVPSLESLGLPEALSALSQRERGLVILAGPTGSGKSTTMAALVDRINAQHARRIVTIEDPIEYRHESRRSIVTQRAIGRDTPSLG